MKKFSKIFFSVLIIAIMLVGCKTAAVKVSSGDVVTPAVPESKVSIEVYGMEFTCELVNERTLLLTYPESITEADIQVFIDSVVDGIDTIYTDGVEYYVNDDYVAFIMPYDVTMEDLEEYAPVFEDLLSQFIPLYVNYLIQMDEAKAAAEKAEAARIEAEAQAALKAAEEAAKAEAERLAAEAKAAADKAAAEAAAKAAADKAAAEAAAKAAAEAAAKAAAEKAAQEAAAKAAAEKAAAEEAAKAVEAQKAAKKGGAGTVILIIVLVLLAAACAYYFLVFRKKNSK